MICVRTGGPHLDESAAARRCAELYASLKGEDQPAAPTVRGETAPLAEFVIKKIERGSVGGDGPADRQASRSCCGLEGLATLSVVAPVRMVRLPLDA